MNSTELYAEILKAERTLSFHYGLPARKSVAVRATMAHKILKDAKTRYLEDEARMLRDLEEQHGHR